MAVSAGDKIPHNTIWLQWWQEDPDLQEWPGIEGITWCEDRLNQNDIRYVRVGFLLEMFLTRQRLDLDDYVNILKGTKSTKPGPCSRCGNLVRNSDVDRSEFMLNYEHTTYSDVSGPSGIGFRATRLCLECAVHLQAVLEKEGYILQEWEF